MNSILAIFITLHLLFLCPSAQGLTLAATVGDLYDDVMVNLFDMVDYTYETSRQALPRLLLMEDLDFRHIYNEAHLNEQQFRSLFEAFFDDPTMHPLIFPVELVGKSRANVGIIRDRLKEYQTGVIKLHNGHEFALEDLKIIFLRLGPHPELCGNRQAEELLWTIDLPGDWRIYDDLLSPDPSQAPKTFLFYYIETVLTNAQASVALADGSLADSATILRRVTEVTTLEPGWERSFVFLKRVLERNMARSKMNAARRAFWKGKLLSLLCRDFPKRCENMSLRREEAQFFIEKITNYLKYTTIELIPPTVLRDLVYALDCCGFHLTNLSMKKLIELNSIFPSGPCIGGSVEMYFAKWQASLRRKRQKATIPPTIPISMHEAMIWWAEYERLEDVLYIGDHFMAPLQIIHQEKVIPISRVADFLTIITDHVWEIIRLRYGPLLREGPLPVETKAFVRTLFMNVLAKRNCGFPIDIEDLAWIYEEIPGSSAALQYATFLSQGTLIDFYIPRALLLSEQLFMPIEMQRYRVFKAHRQPDMEMIRFRGLLTYSILSLALFFTLQRFLDAALS